MFRDSLLFVATCCLLSVITGCSGGGSAEPPVSPAKGTLTLDGAPASGVIMTFVPQEGVKGRGGVASTDADGRFAVQAAGAAGLAPGQYRVMLERHVAPDGSVIPPEELTAETASKNVLHPIYSDPVESPVLVTIPEAGDENLVVEIQSRPRR